MEIICRPTIEFDNEKKIQRLHDERVCRESVKSIALLIRANQGSNECFWSWCGATCYECDKLVLVVSEVFHRANFTFERVFLLWQRLWKIITAILHQHSAMPRAKLMTRRMMQSFNAFNLKSCHTALSFGYFSIFDVTSKKIYF